MTFFSSQTFFKNISDWIVNNILYTVLICFAFLIFILIIAFTIRFFVRKKRIKVISKDTLMPQKPVNKELEIEYLSEDDSDDTFLEDKEKAEQPISLDKDLNNDNTLNNNNNLKKENQTQQIVSIAKSESKKAVYRVHYDKKNASWVVKKDGNERVTRRLNTKAEALAVAKELCKRQEANMTIQKKDGKFQKK